METVFGKGTSYFIIIVTNLYHKKMNMVQTLVQ